MIKQCQKCNSNRTEIGIGDWIMCLDCGFKASKEVWLEGHFSAKDIETVKPTGPKLIVDEGLNLRLDDGDVQVNAISEPGTGGPYWKGNVPRSRGLSTTGVANSTFTKDFITNYFDLDGNALDITGWQVSTSIKIHDPQEELKELRAEVEYLKRINLELLLENLELTVLKDRDKSDE